MPTATATLERPALEVPFDLILAAEAVEEADGKRIVEGFAATSDLDLQGDIIQPEALDKAAAGAIGLTVLLNHNEDQIIGKVVDARAIRDGGEGKLWVKVEIDSGEDKVWAKIQQGMLNKFSIRGKVEKAHRRFDRKQNQQVNIVEELTLLEVSLVAVPANPKALAVRAYIAKGLAEFVKSGGLIPVEGAEKEETTMSLREKYKGFCAEKGFDPFVVAIGDGQDEAEILKAVGNRAVQTWVEFCKTEETLSLSPVPYPYEAPLKKANDGDAAKLIGDAIAALKMETPDVAEAIILLGKAEAAANAMPEPAKAEGEEKPVADAGKQLVELLDDMISKATDGTKEALAQARKLVEQLIAAGAKTDDTPAKGGDADGAAAAAKAVEPKPAPVAPTAEEAQKAATKAAIIEVLAELGVQKAEVVKPVEDMDLTFTQEEVDAITRKLLQRVGVLKERE